MQGILSLHFKQFITSTFGDCVREEWSSLLKNKEFNELAYQVAWIQGDSKLLDLISLFCDLANQSFDYILELFGHYIVPIFGIELNHKNYLSDLLSLEDRLLAILSGMYPDMDLNGIFKLDKISNSQLIINHSTSQRLFPLLKGILFKLNEDYSTKIKSLNIYSNLSYCELQLEMEFGVLAI